MNILYLLSTNEFYSWFLNPIFSFWDFMKNTEHGAALTIFVASIISMMIHDERNKNREDSENKLRKDHLLSMCFDFIITSIFTVIISIPYYWITKREPGILMVYFYLISSFFYQVYCLSKNGKTSGKSVVFLLVVKENGEKLKFHDALIRCVIGFISLLIFPINLYLLLFGNSEQLVQDIVARTKVIRDYN